MTVVFAYLFTWHALYVLRGEHQAFAEMREVGAACLCLLLFDSGLIHTEMKAMAAVRLDCRVFFIG